MGNSIGDEPHDESDSRLVRRVGIRTVDDSAVMKRHLAGPQRNIYSARLVDDHLYLLATP